MPDHLNALVVILFLSTAVFAIARAPACAEAIPPADFKRRRALWFAVVLTAFLAHSFWLYILLAGALVLAFQRAEPNKLAMYFFVLLAVPGISAEIPGLGIANHLFEIDYPRLLALTLLLPAYLSLRKQHGVEPFGRLAPDKILACYLVLGLVLAFAYGNITVAVRKGLFYAFVDIFLPYYVASRCVRNVQQFRDVLMSFAVAALVLSPVLFFEFAKQWLLYGSLDSALGVQWGWGLFLLREGNLRASGTVGHPIVAGYAIAIAAAFYFFLRRHVGGRTVWILGLLVLLAGLLAPLSRGPWVGAAAMALVFVLTGRAPAVGLTRLAILGALAVPVLLASPAGQTIIDHLPWVGSIEARNVEGRERMTMTAFRIVFENDPFFGSSDFITRPEMEALRGPDGLIDLISTYVVIALTSGFVGLSLFGGFFISIGLLVYRGMRSVADRTDERYVLGQTLLATLLGIVIIIGTVAPVLLVPRLYWAVGGLGFAYAALLARGTAPQAAARPAHATMSRPAARPMPR
jgi:hypothetical protein